MTDDLTVVQVTQNALIAFIEQVACAGSTDIKVSQGDAGWYVTYRPPFTREVKEDAEAERHALKVACGMSDCEHNAECVRQCRTYCGGKFYVKRLPLESEAKNG